MTEQLLNCEGVPEHKLMCEGYISYMENIMNFDKKRRDVV